MNGPLTGVVPAAPGTWLKVRNKGWQAVVGWSVFGQSATPIVACSNEDSAVELPTGEVVGPTGRVHENWHDFAVAHRAAKST